MPSYLRVRWIHSDPTDPVLLYMELDDERWETRKVEIFADGRRDFASESEATGETRLGEMPVPTLEEIASDPESESEPVEITHAEFEELWAERSING